MQDFDLRPQAYDALYSEIRSNAGIVANLFTVTITAVATIIGFGVQLEQAGLFLAVFVVLIPALSFISSQMESTLEIASYVVVNFEGEETGVRWETDVLALRRLRAAHTAPGALHKYGGSIAGLFAVIGVACLILPWNYIDTTDPASVSLVVVFSILAAALLFTTVRDAARPFGVEKFEEYVDAWKEIRGGADG